MPATVVEPDMLAINSALHDRLEARGEELRVAREAAAQA
jgi:hypothetical protein